MSKKSLKFQEAMARLEEITNLLNQKDLELEDAMSLFEEALSLTNQCEHQLKDFENRINQLTDVKEDEQ